MSQTIEKRKEEETEEFTNLFHLLNKLAANNKDPNKVISIDTDELLRSNKPLETLTKEDPVPTRVLTIDDFLPSPAPASVAPLTPLLPSASDVVKTVQPSTSEPKSSHACTLTIGIDLAQSGLSTTIPLVHGKKESNMTITIGVDVSSNSSIHFQQVNDPGNRNLPTWNNTIQELRVDPPLEPFQRDEQEQEQEQDQEQDQEVQEGEVSKQQLSQNNDESSGQREFQIGEGDPLIFNYPSCKACKKSFSHFKHLKNHLKRYPVCGEWIQTMEKDHKIIPKRGIHVLVEDYLHKIITGDKPFQCKYCKNIFTNTSNHHKHYHTFMACNRMAIADFIKHVNEMVT
jgi:hypothetical protein